MQRWFLSYHSPDQALAERLKAAIEGKDSSSRVFFAPMHLRAGGCWSAQLAQEIADGYRTVSYFAGNDVARAVAGAHRQGRARQSHAA